MKEQNENKVAEVADSVEVSQEPAKETVETEPKEDVSEEQEIWNDYFEDEEVEDKQVEEREPANDIEVLKEEAPVEDYKAKYEELSKELEKYRETDKQVEEPKKEVSFDKELSDKVILREFTNIVYAMNTLDINTKIKGMQLLQKYAQTQNPNVLKEAKKLLNPEVLEEIAIDKKLFENEQRQEIERANLENTYNAVKEKLTTFVKDNKEWLDNPVRVNAVSMVVDAFGVDADLNQVKSLVDSIEKEAIKRYEESKQEKNRKEILTSPNNANKQVSSDKWFTKAEIERMSEAEYVKNGDKIALQMSLEKQGELPRTII